MGYYKIIRPRLNVIQSYLSKFKSKKIQFSSNLTICQNKAQEYLKNYKYIQHPEGNSQCVVYNQKSPGLIVLKQTHKGINIIFAVNINYFDISKSMMRHILLQSAFQGSRDFICFLFFFFYFLVVVVMLRIESSLYTCQANITTELHSQT